MLVDEEVVLATLKVEVTAVSLIGKEYLLPVGHVAPHAHVASSTEGEAEQAQLLLQCVEHVAAVREAAATFVVAVAKHNVCVVGEVACEAGKPLAACGVAWRAWGAVSAAISSLMLSLLKCDSVA